MNMRDFEENSLNFDEENGGGDISWGFISRISKKKGTVVTGRSDLTLSSI